MLHGSQAPDEGRLVPCYPLGVGYVPQQVDDATLSGGERFQRALTAALPQATDLLLLDEPSNHLDAPNRRALLRLLGQFPASLVIVSHDEALIAPAMAAASDSLRIPASTACVIPPGGRVTVPTAAPRPERTDSARTASPRAHRPPGHRRRKRCR